MTPCHTAAQRYLAMGLHPIPARGKIPAVAWKEYQHAAPHADQIDVWWEHDETLNVGLVIGRGLIVVDLDGPGAEGLLHNANIALPKDAPRVKTGNGFHVYLAVEELIGDRIGLLTAPQGGKPQVDVRGIGFVVAPPSRHPNGQTYEWLVPIGERPVPAAPSALLSLLRAPKLGPEPARSPGHGWVAEALAGVGEGLRDVTCTKLAGYLIGKGLDRETVAVMLIEGFARNCTPPLSPADVRKCVDSIARKHGVTGDEERTVVPRPLSAVLDQLVVEMHSRPTGIVEPPYPALREFLSGGFYPGELVYIGARPGTGKTAFGLEIARRSAKRGVASLFISREMLNVALARRMVAQEARVRASALRRSALDSTEESRVAATLPRMKQWPVYLSDEAVSISEMVEMVASWAQPHPLGLVIVDYLQLVRAPREIRERRLQVEAVSQSLKTLAIQFKLPVLCLSSLARLSQGEARPTLASLRESGELEHDADVVLLLHREATHAETECIVAKNRDGQLGIAHLTFAATFVSFEETSTRENGEA